MIASFLLFTMQSVDDADRLNLALTKCLFATSRAAAARGESDEQFRTTLSMACLAEESSMRAVLTAILIDRGETRAAANVEDDETLQEGRRAVIRAYSYR
jgi:hypothetical protein